MEQLQKSRFQSSLTTIAVIGLIIVAIFGIYKAANSWDNVTLSDQTPSTHEPIKIDSISFTVYDNNYNPIGTIGPGGVFHGGFKYPDVSVFTSQPFFVDSSGRPTNDAMTRTYNVVIDGINYVATETFYGIDFGARTHVDLGQVVAGEDTKFNAEISPYANFKWSVTDNLGWIDGDTLSPPTNDPYEGTVHYTGSNINAISGSLVFSEDFGAGCLQVNPSFNFGSMSGSGTAFITQSLSPFFHEWADARASDPAQNGQEYKNLDANYFGLYSGYGGTGKAAAAQQQLQTDYVMTHYKVQPVYVVPSVQIEAQSAPVWQSYSRTTTLPNGTKINIAVNYTGCISGFRNAYVSNITQYEQTGQITNNLYKTVQNNATVLAGLSGASTGLSSANQTSSSNNPGLNNIVHGAASISGSLIYKGPEKYDNGSVYQTRFGSAWMTENIAGLPAGDYHFSVNSLSDISNMPTKATLSTSFHLQPAGTISWADEEVDANYYIWDGNIWESFWIGPTPSTFHVYYPYSLDVNNMYCIERVVVDTWTLSRYSLTMTSNGSPINGQLLTDDELTNITNNPWIDNNVQTVPIPASTDWLTVVIWIVVVIIAVIVIIAIINRNKGRVTVEVKMEKERKYRG